MSMLNQHIESITELIDQIEDQRVNGKLNKADSEMIIVLNTCYELLARTQTFSKQTITDEGGNEKPRYIHSSRETLDEILFRFATGKGFISLPYLVRAILDKWKPTNSFRHFNQVTISKEINIRYRVLNGFLNNISAPSASCIERIINYIQDAKKEVAYPGSLSLLKEETIV